ncbi:MAG TPA: hypothetical protein VFV08_07160, partial [Puia sp.]|nr:hypothetical protein [Puia sp.]
VFPDQVNFSNTYGRIEGAPTYGGSLMFNATRSFGVELMYNRVEANSGIYTYGTQSPISQNKVVINYAMAGPVVSLFASGSVHPFFGALLGAGIFSPMPNDNTSNVKFAWGGQVGANIYVAPQLGIRLKAQVLSPVESASGGFYFGDFGYGTSVSTYSAIYQFGFSAGLIIGLGKILPKPRPKPVYHTQQPSMPPPPQRRVYYYSPYPPPPPPPPPPPGYYYYH